MKKILILICLIFMTGCTARYTIEFNDDEIKDNLTVNNVDSEMYNIIKKGEYAPVPAYKDAIINLEEPVKNEGVEYYDIKGKDGNAYLDYKFKLSDFDKSHFANTCYDYFKVFREKDEIVFSTGEKFKCFFPGYNLDSVEVVFKSNHKVIYNNADEVDGDSYIWHITKENKNHANIQISFEKDVKKRLLSRDVIEVFIWFLIVGGVLFIIGLFIYFRYKMINKF